MLLGEGPAWDPARRFLWFVDIKKRRVHRFDPVAASVQVWPAPSEVGWVLPCDGGKHVVGLREGLALFDAGDGSFEPLVAVEPGLPGNRLNDATVAPDGSIWFGTMDDGESEASGRVYRFDGAKVIGTAIPPVTIANGPAVTADGRTLYHVDTAGGVIYAVAVDARGVAGELREFVRIDPEDGHPDGVTLDSRDNVWVAIWGGWSARCYSPAGRLLAEVRFPASNITKLAFGGPELRTAYATSARIGLTEDELARQPCAGSLFAFEVDIAGRSLPLARLQRS